MRGLGTVASGHDQAALLAIDDPAMWRMMRDEKLSLHVGVRLPLEHSPLSGAPAPQ